MRLFQRPPLTTPQEREKEASLVGMITCGILLATLFILALIVL
jgi:hypothetical protein